MIIIYKEFIKNNINKLTMNDLEKFAQKNHIEYSQYDLIIIYNFIMNNYNELLERKKNLFNKIKDKINSKLYDEIIRLYKYYLIYILSC